MNPGGAETEALKHRVLQALTKEIGPGLGMDVGGFEVLDISDGIARLRLGMDCGCCPGSLITVIEQELHRLVPEVEGVEVVG